MARTIRNSRLESRTARRRLDAQARPYWQELEAGVQAMEKSSDLWRTFRPFPNPSSLKQDDREAQFYLCARKYAVLTYREWEASERNFLRR